MKKIADNIKEWARKNWDDIRILLLIGIPSGILCMILSRFMDFSKLF